MLPKKIFTRKNEREKKMKLLNAKAWGRKRKQNEKESEKVGQKINRETAASHRCQQNLFKKSLSSSLLFFFAKLSTKQRQTTKFFPDKTIRQISTFSFLLGSLKATPRAVESFFLIWRQTIKKDVYFLTLFWFPGKKNFGAIPISTANKSLWWKF